MAAFRIAIDDWAVDMLETDARLTADGRVVLIHDATVDRTCEGRGAVAEMAWADLQDVDAGYHFKDLQGATSFRGKGVRVPLLEEVLESFPDVRVNVETKCPEVAAPIVELVRRMGAEDRVLVAAQHESHRRGARGYEGPWGASQRQITTAWIAHRLGLAGAYRPGFDILQVPERWYGLRVTTPGFIRAAHRWNVPVHVWVVDEAEDMRRLLAWGVDGLQADRLDVLAGILTEVAGRPPAPAQRSKV
jgi:glycerophosphoryl diester phosphodiesterase